MTDRPTKPTKATFVVESQDENTWRWRMVGDDGTQLARSTCFFPTIQECVESIEEFRRIAPTAEVIDLTAEPAEEPGSGN